MKKMMNGTTPRRMAFHCHRWWACESTIARVLNEPVIRTTVTTVMPRAAS